MQNDIRRASFVDAADELFLEKGITSTSVGDITSRVGVTRSLFYHYFDDKDDITDAVIDMHVDEFMGYVQNWTLGLGDCSISDSLIGLARIARTYLEGPTSFGNQILVESDAGLYQRFVVRSSRLLADYFVNTRGKRGAFINWTDTRHPWESLYMLSVGIMSMMVRREAFTDEVVADLIADTLHIDLGQQVYRGGERK